MAGVLVVNVPHFYGRVVAHLATKRSTMRRAMARYIGLQTQKCWRLPWL